MRSTPILIALSALSLLLLPVSTKSANPKLLMAVLGDSISAGTFSDIPIRRNKEIHSQAFFENKKTLSWASGKKIMSHFVALRNWLTKHGDGRTLDVLNVSFPGDRTDKLPAQADQIVKAIERGAYDELAYTTILIGSNDACDKATDRGVPVDQMRNNLLAAFERLSRIRQNSPLRILLVGIPRIPELGASHVRQARTLFGLSCELVRDRLLRTCRPLLRWSTPEQYNHAMEVVEEKNRMLRLLADEINAMYPNIKVVYSNRLYHLNIPINILAADCFHPGERAQQAISSELWLDQPWFTGAQVRTRKCSGVSITQSGPKSVEAGSLATFEIRLSNEGDCAFTDATFTNFLPRRSYFHDASPDPKEHPNPGQRPAEPRIQVEKTVWNPVSLNAYNGYFEFKITVETQGPGDRIITNTACFEHPNAGRICSDFDVYVSKIRKTNR